MKTHLAIESGGIMPGPENIKQRLVVALFGVVLNPDHLGVVGRARTYILVRGIMHKPLRVTYLGLGDSRHPLEGQLDPPKTTRPELGELLARSGYVVVGALGYGGGGGVDGGISGGADAEAQLVEPAHFDGGRFEGVEVWGTEGFERGEFEFGDGERGFEEGGEGGCGYGHGGCSCRFE